MSTTSSGIAPSKHTSGAIVAAPTAAAGNGESELAARVLLGAATTPPIWSASTQHGAAGQRRVLCDMQPPIVILFRALVEARVGGHTRKDSPQPMPRGPAQDGRERARRSTHQPQQCCAGVRRNAGCE
jgi:hypothetical protein